MTSGESSKPFPLEGTISLHIDFHARTLNIVKKNPAAIGKNPWAFFENMNFKDSIFIPNISRLQKKIGGPSKI